MGTEWYDPTSWALLLLALVFYIIQAFQMLWTSRTLGVSIAAYIYDAVLNIGWVVTGLLLHEPVLWVTGLLYILASVSIVVLKYYIEMRFSRQAQSNLEHLRRGMQVMRFFHRYRLAKGYTLFAAKPHKQMHHHEKGKLRYIFCFKDKKQRLHCCYVPISVGKLILQLYESHHVFSEEDLHDLENMCCEFEYRRNLFYITPFMSSDHPQCPEMCLRTFCGPMCCNQSPETVSARLRVLHGQNILQRYSRSLADTTGTTTTTIATPTTATATAVTTSSTIPTLSTDPTYHGGDGRWIDDIRIDVYR